MITEGQEITAWCSAPGETGTIIFYFYDNSTKVMRKYGSSTQLEVKFPLSSAGLHQIHCRYRVVADESPMSEVSNSVTVSVRGSSTLVGVLVT